MQRSLTGQGDRRLAVEAQEGHFSCLSKQFAVAASICEGEVASAPACISRLFLLSSYAKKPFLRTDNSWGSGGGPWSGILCCKHAQSPLAASCIYALQKHAALVQK